MRQGSVIAILLGLLAGAIVLVVLLQEPESPAASQPDITPGTEAGPRLQGAGLEAAAQSEFTLSGWVLENGRPAAARVVVLQGPGDHEGDAYAPVLAGAPPTAEADATVADGFALDVPQSGWHLVGVTRGDEPPAGWHRIHIRRGENRLHLTLPTGSHNVSVLLRTSGGSPRQGAVRILGSAASSGGGDSLGPLETDDNGRASFTKLYAGAIYATATLRGGMTLRGPVVRIPRAEALVLVAPDHPRRVSVTVVDASSEGPVAGATVRASGETRPGQQWSLRRTTDAAGGATVSIPSAQVGISVNAPGYESATQTLPSASATRISVTLHRKPSVHGTVVQADDGTPVPNVRLSSLEIWDGDISSDLMFGAPRTDAAGRFRMSGMWWTHKMPFVFDGGWMSVGLSDVSKGYNPLVVDPADVFESGITLRVVPAARVDGIVQDAQAKPIAGVTVSAEQWRLREEHGSGLFDGPLMQQAVSGEDGRFHLHLVPGWSWYLSAEGAGMGLDEQKRVRPTENPNPELVLVVAPDEQETEEEPPVGLRTEPLIVRVVEGPERTPVSGAAVTVTTVYSSFHRPLVGGTRTGPDGIAILADLPGEPLRVSARTGAHPQTSVDIEPEQTEVTIRLTAARTITGQVSIPAEKDRAASGSALTIYARTGAGPGEFERVDTDVIWSGDRFTVGPLPNGTYDIYAERRVAGRRYRSPSVRALAGEHVRLELEEQIPGKTRGKRHVGKASLVVRAPDGTLIPDASLLWLTVRRDQTISSTLWSIDDGIGSLLQIKRGSAYIDIVKPELENRRRPPYGALRVGPLLPGDELREIEVTLPPEKLITGRILGPDGQPVGGARLTAYATPPPGTVQKRNAWASSHAFSAPDGRFRIRQLGDLGYDIAVGGGPGALPVLLRNVEAGTSDLTIKLRPSVDVTLTIVDGNGAPVPKARVEVYDKRQGHGLSDFGRAKWSDEADEQGVVRLRGLDPEHKYDLVYSGPYGVKRQLPATTVTGWTPQDAQLAFVAMHAVSGRVQLADGRAPHAARVRLTPLGERFGQHAISGRIDATGQLRVAGVPPGTARLSVSLPDYPEPTVTVIRVPGPPVELVIDPATSVSVPFPAQDGVGERAMWRLVRYRYKEEPLSWRRYAATAEGPLHFRGLDARFRYGLFVSTVTPDGALAMWAPDFAPVEGPMHLPWVPLASLKVRLELPASIPAHIQATAWISHPVLGRVRAKGREVITLRGLPPDRWTVEASIYYGDDTWSGSATIATGAEGTIKLELRK